MFYSYTRTMWFTQNLCFLLFTVHLLGVIGNPEKCVKCVPKEKCDMFGQMSKMEQERWIQGHPCQMPEDEDLGPLFGFAPMAKGDLVCCPYSNIWGLETPSRPHEEGNENKFQDVNNRFNNPESNYNDNGYNQDNLHKMQNSNLNRDESKNDDVSYEQSRQRRPWNRNWLGNQYGRNPPRNIGTINGGNGNFFNPVVNPNFNRPSINNGRLVEPSGYGGNGGTGNPRQCRIFSFPPNPQSGCCGMDIAADRMFGTQNNFGGRPAQPNRWNQPFGYSGRFTRETPEDFGISLDNRIAGGQVTDLYQFPWTVLLKTTFDYGDRKSSFNCGGSLISSRYVLTAAHCVHEDNAQLSNVDVYLAEYDKRTFPRDCVTTPEGRKCIDNILLQAENVVSHPNYDEGRLQNDIALIRLRENVPYTEYTRPICLPPINIDNPEYSNLRLAVAGWGRNGSAPSDIKQSTVVNLIPQQQCARSYPHLTNKHLCAAGRSGEDTCKGDSGGPLMMLYEGKYYVSGVVSGKRADAPCGTAVPSLYTNVFHFVNWIGQNMRN